MTSPGRRYATFSKTLLDQRSEDWWDYATAHADEATELLADTPAGNYVITPPNLIAAQAHAMLAQAYATLAASGGRS